MAQVQHATHAHEHQKPNTKAIWRTFWILLVVTTLEFIVALGTPFSHGIKVVLYAIMTIIKAFYIVAEFMHLRYEVRFLIWAIILPMVFVVWLLVALIVEGGSIFQMNLMK
ncbi:MAG: cytochrome C oxidase subunit IV family protein [Microscillaceae bacterium]|nr:cytochrome C oxidase subunit IV family protein [Microscillaceae bacterium]MDW8461731.1 cytochrome C oxidase subunit IV family protein [Cytophagales bacterium]